MPVLRQLSIKIFGEEGDVLVDSTTQALIVASSMLVMGSMLVSPLIADLAVIFSVSEAYAGWLIVTFTAAAAAMLPVVGAMADRIGRKPILITGLVIFGGAGAAVGLASTFEVALALRALQGVGFAFASPIILTLFGDIYSGSRETTVQGIRVSANSVVNTIVPLLAGVLFVYSWRFPFAVYLVAIPVAAWIWISVPTFEDPSGKPFTEYVQETLTFLGSVPITLLMLSFLLRFVVFYGLITYISVLALQEIGLSVVAVGALLSIRGVVKTLSSTQAGRLSVSYDPAFLSFVSFSLVSGGTVLMGAIPMTATIVLGTLVWGVGDGLLSPCQKSLVNRLSPPEYRGGAMATALTFQNVGKVIGPLGLGLLLGSFDTALAFVILGSIGGGLGTILLFVVWQR